MLEFLIDLWQFAKKNKKLWIFPIIVLMIMASALILFTEGSAVSSIIYTLF